MADIQGQLIWHELLTRDVAGAMEFYLKVVGWKVAAIPTATVDCTIFRADGDPVAAVIDTSRAAAPRGTPNGWIGYVGAENVDETVEHVVRLGGAVEEAPLDVGGIGRFAIVADPQGALIGLFAPAPDNHAPGPRPSGTIGHIGWRELYTSDPEAAAAFYRQVFGWEEDQAFDMGPAGRYQLFSIGGQPAGGMMRMPPNMSRSTWSPFVQIQDIASVEQRVTKMGGAIVDGLREVPGGNWTVKCVDLHGAIFALSGQKVHPS